MTTTATQMKPAPINGIDVEALSGVVRDVTADPAKGLVEFRVNSAWMGQTRSRTTVDAYRIGGQEVRRHFSVDADEPFELLGTNRAANPQELLMSAFNACIMVGYVVGASCEGITLDSLAIETRGTLDLRGFLGIDAQVPAGYEAIQVTVRIKGDGTAAQFAKIHDTVRRTSPNWFNITRPVRVDAELVVEA
ncbi:MAG: OsmC family protein [Deltaproteobacteria bacterium]|nr:OsmC family protein [Deltaproteobacteria bacterium]